MKYIDQFFGIPLCFLLGAINQMKEFVSSPNNEFKVGTILVIKFWGIGNIVLLAPALKMLRKQYPQARIYFLTLSFNRELLEGYGFVDEIIDVEIKGIIPFLIRMLKNLFYLHQKKIDLLVDFEQFSRVSTISGYLVGASQRIGFNTLRQGRGFLYTAPVPYNDHQHMSKTFMDLVKAAGVEDIDIPHCPVPVKKEDVLRVSSLVPVGKGPLVLIHAGSGDNFTGRRWPGESFARLADMIIGEMGARVIFTGVAKEKQLVGKVIRMMKEEATDLSGKLSLRELCAQISMCTLIFSNDTAPVHLASSLGIPVFGFYGPNTPLLYGPLSRRSVAFYDKLPCSPCITNFNAKTSNCIAPICIQHIKVEQVMKEVREFFKSSEVKF